MIETLVYIFSIGAFFSGILVISSKNPINSVLGLVMCFANSSILLLMLGFEFLALLFLIVYVGALAILFLFVVMMLNIRLVELIENFTRYLPIGGIIGIIFILELMVIVDEQFAMSSNNLFTQLFFINNPYELSLFMNSYSVDITSNYNNNIVNLTNIESIGQILYTHGYIYFIVSSIVLLIAMVGAIVLTLYHEQGVKRQDIFSQISTQNTLTYFNSINNLPDFKLRN
ncbi:NADH dehydrogenase subunit 6 (mitochondrion) [Monosiga brevicollis]|uniref:NADH-ubiquinone oxidoreductase chain 6 n=1 Tax=Monosiga brevicollis TaxID=81824 RepID=Q8HIS0_MONBE|nr:NADH dehydrogenase subunit 6 [Monosiga brevicollis]AAN28364.1 NADH dehydrogenase subunit 6 [Monosiga brevicollis]|eukprot:NP_696994.1 NADH dehydrogenase subunit 6 (mitochondrion) [Monosiga brevicollis ATCC 50154]